MGRPQRRMGPPGDRHDRTTAGGSPDRRLTPPRPPIRLEDVKGETLMVQIASKSMLLNTMTARRIVDECISPKHRELIEAAKAAKAASAAS